MAGGLCCRGASPLVSLRSCWRVLFFVATRVRVIWWNDAFLCVLLCVDGMISCHSLTDSLLCSSLGVCVDWHCDPPSPLSLQVPDPGAHPGGDGIAR